MNDPASVRESAVFQPGDIVEGKYRIKKLLAEGGMGSVYHAIQEPLGRDVALKVLKPMHEETPEKRDKRMKRFFREASLLSRLNHPNTVMIFDYGELSKKDGYFLVMEFIEGGTLRDFLDEHQALPTDLALHIATQIASSLHDVHKGGVLHRDLKPPNVMLVDRGGDPHFVKVVDFGLVKEVNSGPENDELTAENALIGSPMYMAPERFLYYNADSPQVDIYSLGIMIYEMLVGRPPFIRESDSTIHQIMMMHVQSEPPPMFAFRPDLSIPDELERMVMRCLEKKPEDRFETMQELVDIMRRCMPGATGAYAPVSSPSRKPMFEEPSSEWVPQETGKGAWANTGESTVSARGTRTDSAEIITSVGSDAGSSAPVSLPQDSHAQAPSQPRIDKTARSPFLLGGIIIVVVAIMLAVVFSSGSGAPSNVTVFSEPPGAMVYLENRSLGRTPFEVELTSDQLGELTFELEGYQTFTQRLPDTLEDSFEVRAILEPVEVAMDEPSAIPDSEVDEPDEDVALQPEAQPEAEKKVRPKARPKPKPATTSQPKIEIKMDR